MTTVALRFLLSRTFIVVGCYMGQPPALSANASIHSLFQEFFFTLGRLRADKDAKLLVSSFAPFREKLWEALKQELLLEEALVVAKAVVDSCDNDLDDVCDAVLGLVLNFTRGNYGAALYKRFAGEARPSVFKRPILGKQLTAVELWLHILAEPNLPEELRELRGSVEQVVQAAKNAISERDKATQERSNFSQIGGRKQLVDAFSAEREHLYESLVELAKKLTDRKVEDPEAFARRFFPSRRIESAAEGKAALSALDQEIAFTEGYLDELKKKRQALQEEEDARQKEEQEKEILRAELAASEEALQKEKQRIAALKAKLSSK